MVRATISVIKNEAGEVLLLKRSAGHSVFPEQWCFPGGKFDYIQEKAIVIPALGARYEEYVNRWETAEECAFRETVEETGVQMRLFTSIRCIHADSKHMVYPFISMDPHTDEEVTREFPNREHSEYGWFNQHNAPREAGPMTQRLLKLVFDETVFI